MSSISFTRVRRRSLGGSTVVLVAAALTAPLSAQTLDLNRVLRSLPVPQSVYPRRRADERGAGMRTPETLGVVSSCPAPVRGANPWLPYVEDTLFSGHFGKTYDQLTGK